ncbi:MAG: hypothetical protein KAR45_23285, partial [Desulfobacteraceae bacterium]|nr:hypothetical protein [Desulfobacteraceae bacterium]
AITKKEALFSGIEIEKQGGGFFAGVSVDFSSMEALHSACSEADEIYINSVFPSEIYGLDSFPKVKKKYLPKLLLQNAIEKSYHFDDIEIKYKSLGKVKDETGIEKQSVAYVAIEKKEIQDILADFQKFIRKVKVVTPLPVSLAKIVSKADLIESDFIIVLIGELESMIIIASPDGIVKVARNIPVGIQESDMTIEEDTEHLASRIEKEMNRTVKFFKHEFREDEPETAYIFSNRKLNKSLSEHFISDDNIEYRFCLKKPLIQNYSEAECVENIQTLSSVLAFSEFNFFKKETRKPELKKLVYFPAITACAACIAALIFFNHQLVNNISKQNTILMEKYKNAKELKGKVKELESKIGKLNPLKDWNIFYNQTFKNQIAWDKIFSELAYKTPSNIVFKSLLIDLDNKNKFKAAIEGDVIAVNWQEGLEMLREFGSKVEASKEFKTIDIKYTPETMDKKIKNFNFSLSLELREYIL